MELDRARKVRSVSADTNVLLDVPSYYPLKAREGSLTSEEKDMLKRCESSLEVLVMCLTEDVKIQRVGLRVVEKELAGDPSILRLYKSVFPPSIKPPQQVKKLAKLYMQEIKIPFPDAMIAALASYLKTDVLFSWNRQDIVKQSVQHAIEEINRKQRVGTPSLITPSDFLSRIYLSNDKSICLSPSPVLQIYRPRFFLPR
jgi:hypothetical protein